MAFLANAALDAAVNYVKTNGTRLDICNAAPTTYAQATSTYSLGNQSITITGPADGDSSGRKVTVPAITGGTVTGNGTVTHYAITDGSSELIAWGTITPQSVVLGSDFALNALDITIPDAA